MKAIHFAPVVYLFYILFVIEFQVITWGLLTMGGREKERHMVFLIPSFYVWLRLLFISLFLLFSFSFGWSSLITGHFALCI